MSDTEGARQPEQSPGWPIGSMMFLGTFGAAHSRAGRRYHTRSWLALGWLIGITALFGWWDRQGLAWPLALVFMATFAFISYEVWRYISSLDELARRLQLESMAITYLIGLAVFFAFVGLSIAMPITIRPAYLIVLEPVRGLVLAIRARHYQ